MINIVFCIDAEKGIEIEDGFGKNSVTRFIEYRDAMLLLDKYLSNVVRMSRHPVSAKLLISYKGETYLIDIRKICYIEITKRIVEVHVSEGAEQIYQAYASIKELEKALLNAGFIRVSRFYLVALTRIRTICGNQIMVDPGKEISVGRSYLRELRNRICEWPNIVVQ